MSLFLSHCVNDDVDNLAEILKQTSDECTEKSERKNKQKKPSWFDISISIIILKRRISLYCELIVSPNEPKSNKCKKHRKKVIFTNRLKKEVHFSEKLTNFFPNERLFFRQ